MGAKRVVVRLTPEEKQMVRELAEMENTSMSEVVRRIIDTAYDELEAKRAAKGSSEHAEGKPSHDD